LSGGLDSAVLLSYIKSSAYVPHVVSFRYGSKHNELELKAAADIARYHNLPLTIIELTSIFRRFKSALLDKTKKVPQGHYEAENMRQTVVPNRNAIFISVLTGLAESRGFKNIALGVHAGDHFIYPDCRPAFIDSMSTSMNAATDGNVTLHAPFVDLTKEEIVYLGNLLKVPFHLTRTCYTSDRIACGKCGSCQERLEAFEKCALHDPLDYTSRELIKKDDQCASLDDD
jgi:7-cyano-7-deazaguanine synthase